MSTHNRKVILNSMEYAPSREVLDEEFDSVLQANIYQQLVALNKKLKFFVILTVVSVAISLVSAIVMISKLA